MLWTDGCPKRAYKQDSPVIHAPATAYLVFRHPVPLPKACLRVRIRTGRVRNVRAYVRMCTSTFFGEAHEFDAYVIPLVGGECIRRSLASYLCCGFANDLSTHLAIARDGRFSRLIHTCLFFRRRSLSLRTPCIYTAYNSTFLLPFPTIL